MKILRIDHVALAVADLPASIELWQAIGLLSGPREFVREQSAEVAFLMTLAEAEACVEIITPKLAALPDGQVDPVANAKIAGLEKFLDGTKDRRGGLHHIAFLVEDIRVSLDELAERGVPLIDRAPRTGARGHEVAFLHPRALGGVLVELVAHAAPGKSTAGH